MKKFLSGITLLAAVAALTSCQDILSEGGDNSKISKDEVAFVLGNKSTTRAEAAQTIVAPMNVYKVESEDGEALPMSLVLSETVTSLDEEFFDATDGGVTRGTPVYTENFNKVYTDGIYGTAYTSQTGKAKITADPYTKGIEDTNGDGEDGTVTFKSNGTTNVFKFNYSAGQSSPLHWPSDGKLLYFLEPVGQNGITNREYYADGSIQFDYETPSAPGDQQDILFTSKVMDESTKDTKNHVLFYHALCGVKFRNGTKAPDGTTVTILQVKFEPTGGSQIFATGHCTITPNYVDGTNTAAGDESNKTGAAPTKSAQCVKWDITYDKGVHDTDTYTLNVTSETNYTKASNTNNFPDEFFSGSTASNNVNDAACSKTFFFIPQNFENATDDDYNDLFMLVTYKVTFADSRTMTRSARVYFNGDWKAGELHTYTLSAENVRVDVDDDMDGTNTTKSNLTTTNKGITPEYQRMFLSANWVYTDNSVEIPEEFRDIIIAQYDVMNDNANFTGYPGANWVLGDDDYWYYLNPIKPDKSPAAPLFLTYKTPEAAPYKGVHLEMNCLVQAVKFDYDGDTADEKKATFKNRWGNTVKIVKPTSLAGQTVYSKLTTTPE